MLALRLACCVGSNSGAMLLEAQSTPVAIDPRPSLAGRHGREVANLRVDSYLVMVPVLVTDDRDRIVTGLEKAHFKIYDNKVEQVLTHFSLEDVPLSVALVFDCSKSMGAKLQTSRTAVADFLKAANPEDEFALIEFNDQARLTIGFTTQIEEIQNRLMFTESKGHTALLDAICLALSEMQHAKHSRKAILIISDGGDNSSRYTTRDVKKRVREADVQICSIAVVEPLEVRERTAEELAGPSLLARISESSGGWLYEVDNPNELPNAAAKIGTALRQQYMLGYSPPALKRNGKYHRIELKVNAEGFARLRASFRTGYTAPAR